MLKKADIVLFDIPQRGLLYPFTQTRAVADIRFGILTAKERWQYIAGKKVETFTAEYISNAKTLKPGKKLFINAAILPCSSLLVMLEELRCDEAIVHDDTAVAFWAEQEKVVHLADIENLKFNKATELKDDGIHVSYPWHLFQYNDAAIRFDFQLITGGRQSKKISDTNKMVSPENIFIEDGAIVEHCIINASAGPVYIGRNTTIMEGSMIRGAFASGESAVLKMGTTIYGATTIGPFCQAGGEIKNSIMMGYSNKAHHGYLGDSVIGEWCNLGAGTSNSNIKNNAGDIIKLFPGNELINAGLKCGVMMGDYTRTAINTSLNTATFAGVACNIFGEGLSAKYIPDFTWGVNDRYIFEKALQHINNWKKLKHQTLTEKETAILKYLYKTIL
ncbi:MAG: putative sugar nucleotidyl transferase [Agriterribacter sp.]